MGARQVQFGTQDSKPFELQESNDLIVVRLHEPEGRAEGLLPLLQGDEALSRWIPHLQAHDSFPESGVYLYRIVGTSDIPAVKENLKTAIRGHNHASIRFIGSVLQYEKSNIYQLYTGNLFVKFERSVSTAARNRLFKTFKMRIKTPLEFADAAYFLEMQEADAKNVFEAAQSLLHLPEVQYAHPELVIRRKTIFDAAPNEVPNELIAPDWVHHLVKLRKAWKASKGSGIRIAVIDDGLDFAHPAFQGNKIASFRDMTDKGAGRMPEHQFPQEKHGTACAGIACSSDPEALGIAPMAHLIPIRTLGLGSVLEAGAIAWAADNGADIISCSWGPPDGDPDHPNDQPVVYPMPVHTRLAIKHAVEKGRKGKGCAIFFAAGNGNEPILGDQYAGHPSVLAIGAVNREYKRSRYSDYGNPLFCTFPSGDYTWEGNARKWLYGVLTADRSGLLGYTTGNYNTMFSGTSAACPGAAGVAALVLSINPTLTLQELRLLLSGSCIPLGSPAERLPDGYHSDFGYGLLRADLAVKNAQQSKQANTMNRTTNDRKGWSLHVGINHVSNAYYGNSVSPLRGCLRDMEKMESLCKKLGFDTRVLSNENATLNNIQASILKLADLARPNDLVCITYAGHGTYLPDNDGDEADGHDEAWVTYDGLLLDDVLFKLFQDFRPTVRILLISDSCHSGTMARFVSTANTASRYVPYEQIELVLKNHNLDVRTLRQQNAGIESIDDTMPRIKLLAACQDHEVAGETENGGLFTNAIIPLLLQKNSRMRLTYKRLIELAREKMPHTQNPQLKGEGGNWPEFDEEQVLSIDGKKATNALDENGEAPSVHKPTAHTSTDTPLLIENPQRLFMAADAGRKNRSDAPNAKEILPTKCLRDTSFLPGILPWDKAYALAAMHPSLGFVEPDTAEALDADPVEEVKRNLNRAAFSARNGSSEEAFIPTYPPAGQQPEQIPLDWHLNDAFSELKKAANAVHPELQFHGNSPFSYSDQPDHVDRPVRVAIIDTGYLNEHPAKPQGLRRDLSISFVPGEGKGPAYDKDQEGLKDHLAEQQGHGHATMNLLAGWVPKGEIPGLSGPVGGAPYVEVLNLRISDTVLLFRASAFSEAVHYAVRQNVDIISMSMAGVPTRAMAKAVEYAYKHGVLMVCAAGNSWVRGTKRLLPDSVLFPAAFPHTIAAVGATYNHVPYLYQYNQNRAVRAEGGKYMQMCYGPKKSMETALAAYTPNVFWFTQNSQSAQYTRMGAGTSSATPQIAAAAALYLQKHRREIESLANNQPWKKVELLKQALFESAYKVKQFEPYFGNGILKAHKALERAPNQLTQPLHQQADIRFGLAGIRRVLSGLLIFRSNRATRGAGMGQTLRQTGNTEGLDAGASNQETLREMMLLELMQLAYTLPDLPQEMRRAIVSEDHHPSETTISAFVDAVLNSSKASSFLKQHLVSSSSEIEWNQRATVRSGVQKVRYAIRPHVRSNAAGSGVEDTTAYQVILNGLGAAEIEFSDTAIEDDTLQCDHLEIAFTSSATRSLVQQPGAIELLVDPELGGSAVLAEVHSSDEESMPYYTWLLPESPVPTISRSSTEARYWKEAARVNQAFAQTFRLPVGRPSRNMRGSMIKDLAKIVFKVFRKQKRKGPDKEKSLLSMFSNADKRKEQHVWKYWKLESDTAWNILNKKGKPKNQAIPLEADAENKEKPILICMHGLFSNLDAQFTPFLRHGQTAERLKSIVSPIVLGFEMPTVFSSVAENAEYLNDFLRWAGNKFGKEQRFIFLCHSRGGLVARYGLEKAWIKNGRLEHNISRLVMMGTPNLGSRLADDDYYVDLLDGATNLIAGAAGLTAPWFGGLTALATALTEQYFNLPGINDLEPGSRLLMDLAPEQFLKADNAPAYWAAASDYEPKGWLRKVLDQWIFDQSVFSGAPNDRIVPLHSALCLQANGEPMNEQLLPKANIQSLGESHTYHHFSYFSQKHEPLLDWLFAKALKL